MLLTIWSGSELDHNTGACAPSRMAPQSSVVLDREPDQEKSLDPSGPRIRCPLCGWSPRKDDRWSCTCRHEWNTFEEEDKTGAPVRIDELREETDERDRTVKYSKGAYEKADRE
jgi:hypothetical protein